MLIQRFRREEHEDYGEDGWLLVGAPSTYVPLWGMGVAHDLLEHRRNDTGTVEEELLAFGAALYVRGEGGYWNRKASGLCPGTHVGEEIGRDLGLKYGGIENGIDDPGRTTRLDGHVEEWIETAVREARKAIREDCEDCEDCKDTSSQDAGRWGHVVELFLRRVVGWLRRGYRLAARRYYGISPYRLATMFAEIEQKADKLLRDDMSSYCEMVIRLDVRKGRVSVYLDESGLDEWAA